MNDFDVIISGGGPAGAAAAWQAATGGARVLLCDKAEFPRDKPCGDGITPRAVQLLSQMGLDDEMAARFHRVGHFRLISHAGVRDRPWPERPGLPSYGYVAARTALDNLILSHAVEAGVDARQGVEVMAPIIEQGAVRGVRARKGDAEVEFRAPITVAADGMSNRLGKMVGMTTKPGGLFGVAVRAQVECARPVDDVLECHLTLRNDDGLIPGYGWVFPMGGDLVNIGIGYLSTYRHYRNLNTNEVLQHFVDSLPGEWRLPTVAQMARTKRLAGWRLPMGLQVWPPWRPGIMAVGDAVGAVKPFTGAGISKALQSGLRAGSTALDVLAGGNPNDLSSYEAALRSDWGAYYRLGRAFSRVIGSPVGMRVLAAGLIRGTLLSDFVVALSTGNGKDGYARRLGGRTAKGLVGLAGLVPERSVPLEQREVVARERTAPRTRVRTK